MLSDWIRFIPYHIELCRYWIAHHQLMIDGLLLGCCCLGFEDI